MHDLIKHTIPVKPRGLAIPICSDQSDRFMDTWLKPTKCFVERKCVYIYIYIHYTTYIYIYIYVCM